MLCASGRGCQLASRRMYRTVVSSHSPWAGAAATIVRQAGKKGVEDRAVETQEAAA
jgi:hypothetical protein